MSELLAASQTEHPYDCASGEELIASKFTSTRQPQSPTHFQRRQFVWSGDQVCWVRHTLRRPESRPSHMKKQCRLARTRVMFS